jgi:hypothetical protein
VQRACDYALYCERNLIERFFNKPQALSGYRHALRQTGKKFPCRGSAGCGPYPPQLKTGPSCRQWLTAARRCAARRVDAAI